MDDQLNPNQDNAQATDISGYRELYSYYAKQLLADLGLADIAQPERGELLEAIEQYTQKVMMNVLLENITEEQADQTEGILRRGGNEQDVILHLLSTTPDIQIVMADALTEAYAKMLSESSQLANALGYKRPEKSTSTSAEPASTPPTP